MILKYTYLKASSQCPKLARNLNEWPGFSDSKVAHLTLDAETENFVRREIPKATFSLCKPTPLKHPRKIAAVSDDVLTNILHLNPEEIVNDPDFADFCSGNKILDGSVPMAHRYGGFQFGYWAGQLGDGRAHLLGAYNGHELQLKGSGKTPYSRFGDGRAVIRSSVREFLCSEAMFHLGIPTSRAAALVVSDDPVMRDMFYDGRAKAEKSAVVLRIAKHWFRIGSLEIHAKNGEIKELKELLDFIIAEYHRDAIEDDEDKYLNFFAEVVRNTAKLMAHWQSVGFTHGVMNTDNFSLDSVTIDYGPFGFVEDYDPHFVPNSSDDMGRYDLESQPSVGFWNLNKLALAIAPVVSQPQREQLDAILGTYEKTYQAYFLDLFRAKLGLRSSSSDAEDLQLLALLLDSMERKYADFTRTFRDLSEIPFEDLKRLEIPERAWALKILAEKDPKQFGEFVRRYAERFDRGDEDPVRSDEERRALMTRSNPKYVLKNWMAQSAIEKAERGDFEEVNKLLRVLRRPFDEQEEAESAGYSAKRPQWAQGLRVSCSS